ncbi:GGDEF domain-containing protein [Lysinibacillus xylanilyticus]|uniref:GGDEF domain-containing protein n=1 Tax=Lysinibacillus xylanilyticus TaxID=582475 RepID=UPI0038273700
MQLTYAISMLPLLNIAVILILLTVFAAHMYMKTQIRTDLHLALSLGVISLLPLILFRSTISIGDKLDFWSKPYHIAGLTVLLATLAISWLAEKRDFSERLPIIANTIVVACSIILPKILGGSVFALSFLFTAIWLYLQATKGYKFEYIRMIFFSSIFISVIGGSLFSSSAFAFLYSLLVLTLLIYETLRYFDRVVSLLRSAGINSITDSLTGLFNKGFLNKKVEQLVQRETISIIFCDIDDFKDINDTKGHEFGDKVLFNVGKVMKRVVGDNGYVCRAGGEEMVCMIVSGDAAKIAEQVRASVEKEVKVTLSVGVANSKELAGQSFDQLGQRTIKKADLRMYAAKQAGKNRVVLSDKECIENNV